jgi:GAF domain-containing protein
LSSNPTLDRESFQKLLASAFAVQESGMKPQSLAAILELQRSIRMGHLDVDGATHLIAEWARSVANASGVAAGRLKGDQLIYTAGSGSAASYIGRRVMATFSTSAPNEANSEILRVEDTTTDARIEAAVCRQFGVKSLLILPIYCQRFVAGVLQVLFNEPHSFQDQEVRTYWILAGLVGEAMSQTPVKQKASEVVAPAVGEEVIEHLPAPPRDSANAIENVELVQTQSPVQPVSSEPRPQVPLSLPLEWRPLLRSRFLLRMPDFPAYKLPVYKRERISGLVAASVILVFTWILYTAPPSTMSSSVAKAPQPPNLTAQQTPPSGARQVPVSAPAGTGFPAQLKYQTVRYVAPASQRRSLASESGRVKHFGTDVTVRYFTPDAAAIKTAGGSEVHHVSDDVTVRYFKSKNLEPQAVPVAHDPHQTIAR